MKNVPGGTATHPGRLARAEAPAREAVLQGAFGAPGFPRSVSHASSVPWVSKNAAKKPLVTEAMSVETRDLASRTARRTSPFAGADAVLENSMRIVDDESVAEPEANPFAAPRAELSQPGPLEPVSVWLMLLYTAFSLGIYLCHWFYTRGRLLSEHLPDRKFPIAVTLIVYVMHIVAAGTFVTSVVTEDLELEKVSNGIDRLSNFGLLYLAFAFRSRLNALAHGMKGRPEWVAGIPTFFFGALYMQYKLNRHDYGLRRSAS